MNLLRTTGLLGALAVTPLLLAHAQSPAPSVQVTKPWARATPGGASTGAAYLTLASPAGDTLTGVSTPAAQTASVHEMAMDGTVMRMRKLAAGLPLPPGRSVTLSPGGYHIMLEGLKAPLQKGQSLPLHLTFAKSPPIDVTASIAALGASGPQ